MRLPTTFLATATRERVASALAPTLAQLRELDPNEAFIRLETALAVPSFLAQVQHATWLALVDRHPQDGEATLAQRVGKRRSRPKRYQGANPRRDQQASWLAFSMRVDRLAGMGTGEAADLLDTPEGQRLLAEGVELAAAHLARELAR